MCIELLIAGSGITGVSLARELSRYAASVAVLGLFPASISTGIGSDVQRPLATVIVYGLIFATIVTLFILPTLYYLVERRAEQKNNIPDTTNTPEP